MILVSNPKFCLEPFEEALEEVESEFEGWEILAERHHSWEHREEVKDALSTTKIQVQVHAPLNDINIASLNPDIRKTSVDEVKKSLKMASMIDAGLVTVHPGIYSPLSRYMEDIIELSKESLIELKRSAEEYGVNLAVENLPEMWLTLCSEPEDIEYLTNEVGLDFCLDIGHAYIADSLEEFLNFSPVNVHIHDNEGDKDLHLPLGEGEINLKRVLRSLKNFKGNYVIEGRNMEDLLESRDYLKRLIGD